MSDPAVESAQRADIATRAKMTLEGVTDGPWEVNGFGNVNRTPGGEHPPVAKAWKAADARFIAQSRTLMPELLAGVERTQEVRDQWRGRAENAEMEIDFLQEALQRARADAASGDDAAARWRIRAETAEAEVDRLRGALDRLAENWIETYGYEGGDGSGPTSYAFKACADGLRAVLRDEH